MKISKKLFVVLSLVAILAGMFATTAFAANTRVVRYADVNTFKVLDNQPATFRLLGSYTCDSVQVNAVVSGKIISVYAYDVKTRYTGRGCGKATKFRKDINVGALVPGVYTIIINPSATGRGQKVFKGFIAPMFPTPVPAAAPVQ